MSMHVLIVFEREHKAAVVGTHWCSLFRAVEGSVIHGASC